MSTDIENVIAVLRGLKVHFGVESDDALADKIDVAKSTIASWRRRGIPRKVQRDLAARFGITPEQLEQDGLGNLRSYVLKQAFFFIVLVHVRALYENDPSDDFDAALADDLALIEPYLMRAIIKAVSQPQFSGVPGAATFLLALRSGEINATALLKEADEERGAAVGRDRSWWPAPTNTPTNIPTTDQPLTKKA